MTKSSSGLCVLALMLPLPTTASAANGWDWSIAPYLWAPTIGADLREGLPPAENQQSFDDWMDKIEFVFLGHVEGQGDRFGVFGDVVYLGLGDSRQYARVRTQGTWTQASLNWQRYFRWVRSAFRGSTCLPGCATST